MYYKNQSASREDCYVVYTVFRVCYRILFKCKNVVLVRDYFPYLIGDFHYRKQTLRHTQKIPERRNPESRFESPNLPETSRLTQESEPRRTGIFLSLSLSKPPFPLGTHEGAVLPIHCCHAKSHWDLGTNVAPLEPPGVQVSGSQQKAKPQKIEFLLGDDMEDLAHALSDVPSETEQLSTVIQALQVEMQKLRDENQELRGALARSKPVFTQWRDTTQTRPVLSPPKFGGSQTQPTALSSTTDQHLQVTVVTPSPVPLANPERFTGDSTRFAAFMSQCQLHFLCKPQVFVSDASKVAFILSYLGGVAADWSIPLIEQNDPILYDFSAFKTAMTRLFAKHVFIQSSDNELLNLRQGSRDLVTYITSFNRLVAETHWPEEKRTSLFYRGLRDDLKDALSHIVDLPEDCAEFINLVVRLDHRLGERKGERPRGDTRLIVLKSEKKDPENKNSDTEPMQIGGIRGPLSSEEKDRRRKANLCLYCGRPGHFARDCSAKPKTKKAIASVRGTDDKQEN